MMDGVEACKNLPFLFLHLTAIVSLHLFANMCACAHGVHFDWDLGREKTTQPAVLTAGPAEAMFLKETAALALAARGRTDPGHRRRWPGSPENLGSADEGLKAIDCEGE